MRSRSRHSGDDHAVPARAMVASSESDIVGPNLQQAVVAGHDDSIGPAPVHRPEIQVGCGAMKLTMATATVAGDLDLLADDQVPGADGIRGDQAEDTAAAVGSPCSPHSEAEPFVDGIDRVASPEWGDRAACRLGVAPVHGGLVGLPACPE